MTEELYFNNRDYYDITSFYQYNLIKDTSEIQKLAAYKSFLNIHLEPFLNFITTFNNALTTFIDTNVLQEDFMMLKFRIKDPSSIQNSSTESWIELEKGDYKNKAIDDVFGVEIQTGNEEQREILSVFMKTLMMPGAKENYHDKSNGYNAYHVLGDCQIDLTVEKNIEFFLLNFPKHCKETICSVDLSQVVSEESNCLSIKNKTENLINKLIDQNADSAKEVKSLQKSIVITIKELLEGLRNEMNNSADSQNKMQIYGAIEKISYISNYFYELNFLNNMRICPITVGKMITKSNLEDETKTNLQNDILTMIGYQTEFKECLEKNQELKEELKELKKIKSEETLQKLEKMSQKLEELLVEKKEILEKMKELQSNFTNIILSNNYLKSLHLDSNVLTAFKTAKSILKAGNFDNQILPVIEFQIKTQDVAHEAIYGRAAHSANNGYKSVDEKKIKEALRTQTLRPGLTAPLKFFRNSSGQIQLQDFYKTIIENYSFTKKLLDIYRNALAQNDPEAISYFNTYDKENFRTLHEIGIVFPAFRQYIDPDFDFVGTKFSKFSPDVAWKHLTTLFLGRDTFSEFKENPIEESQFNKIWKAIDDRYKSKNMRPNTNRGE